MALDATVGGATANSYVTMTEASAYFVDRTHKSRWESFSEQPAALVTASRMLDWYVTWYGAKTEPSVQSMGWPRVEATDRGGEEIASDIIPFAVKTATIELALSSLASDRTADNDLLGIAQIKAGSLSVTAKEDSPYTKDKSAIPDKIWKILTGLYIRNVNVVRLERA